MHNILNVRVFLLISCILSMPAIAEEKCKENTLTMVKAIINDYAQGFLTTGGSSIETCSIELSQIGDSKYNKKVFYSFNGSHYVCNALSQSFRRQFVTQLSICNVSTDDNPKYRVISVKEFSDLRSF